MLTDYGDRPRPRKRFGQHFLHDREVIARIVESVGISPEETLVEIGPGRGALTTSLLERCRLLHLVELDRDLARVLDESFDDESRVTVYQQDVLTFDFRALVPPLGGSLVLVGNLPYNIASLLLIRLLPVVDCIDRAVFMLQREVAHRLAAATRPSAPTRSLRSSLMSLPTLRLRPPCRVSIPPHHAHRSTPRRGLRLP